MHVIVNKHAISSYSRQNTYLQRKGELSITETLKHYYRFVKVVIAPLLFAMNLISKSKLKLSRIDMNEFLFNILPNQNVTNLN